MQAGTLDILCALGGSLWLLVWSTDPTVGTIQCSRGQSEVKTSMRSSRPLTSFALCAALIIVASGCGSSHKASGSASPSSTPTSTSPVATTTPSSSATPTYPFGSPVSADFKAASVTFVSPQEAFVLGTAPGFGTLLVRTLDRGRSWKSLTAPKAPLGRATLSGTRTVWGARFASPSHGFVFGHGLWKTTDGGRQWTLDAGPSGSILSLATIDRQVLALTAQGTAQGDLGPYVLLRRPLAGGSWSRVATLPSVSLFDPTDLISTQAGTAAVLDGTSVLVTTNGGLTVARHATATTGYPFIPSSVAVTSAKGLALLCIAQNYMGHPDKQVYTSPDGGAHWKKAGAPSKQGHPEALAGNGSDLVLATASGASWLDRSANSGQTWMTVVTYGDGGRVGRPTSTSQPPRTPSRSTDPPAPPHRQGPPPGRAAAQLRRRRDLAACNLLKRSGSRRPTSRSSSADGRLQMSAQVLWPLRCGLHSREHQTRDQRRCLRVGLGV